MPNVHNTLVIIPAFNEEERISAVIQGVRTFLPEADVVVVNDGSSDKTAEVSETAGALVVSHPFNLGVGTALQTGYKYAAKNGYDYLIQLDGDGQHDPSYLPKFLSALTDSDADLVIGSRFLGSEASPSSVARRVGTRLFARVVSLLIRERLTDATSGYRAMRRSVLQFCTRDVYGFDYPDADFLLTLHRAGFKLREIPVVIRARSSGRSQHAGLRPVYYLLKMFLSIFIILLRRKAPYAR